MSANTFKDASDLFAAKGLQLPELICLQPDNAPYQVMAIQPSGNIAIRDDFIGNANPEAAKAKFNGFFSLSSEGNTELALAPEYSCPWSSISETIKARRLPAFGKLWIVGCESITPHAFTAFVTAHPEMVWLHEEPLPNGVGRFFGVLCYFLKTNSRSGEPRDVVLVQFKRQAMSDTQAFERDRLITGNTGYFLRNQDDHIRLLSLICAESLVFKPNAAGPCRLDLHPYLIFHPQLNLQPRHVAIKSYRGDLYAANYGERIEVLALNWARGFRIEGKPASSYGGSAVFLRSKKFCADDRRLEANHKRGLYYARWQCHQSQMCLLNFDEHVFHFRTQKVYSTQAAPLFNRTGPEMLRLWRLDAGLQTWNECTLADDGFAVMCNAFEEGDFTCCLGDSIPSVDRERLLALSTGKLQPSKDWHQVDRLRSFAANEDESPNRLLFAQDSQVEALEFRKSHLRNYIKLHKTILTNPANYPRTIADLKGNCTLRAPSAAEGYRSNAFSNDGNAHSATAVFIGQEPPAIAKQLRDQFIAEWGTTFTRRLVIWFEHDNKIKWEHPDLPTVTDDSEHPASIARTGRL